MKILFYGKDLSWGITNPWTNSRLEAVTPRPTMPPEGGALHSSPWAFVLPGFCPYFQISRKYFFSSSLQIHSCFESLPPVDSVLKVCGLLVADPCRSMVIFHTVLYFFQWWGGFCWRCYKCLFVCRRRLLLFLKQKSSIALCIPCQRKSQSGCLSTRKKLYSAIPWATARVSMWCWPRAKRALLLAGRWWQAEGGSESSPCTFSGNRVQTHFPGSYIPL